MARRIKIAAVQMDATPAPVVERLDRAADLIAEAASAGAQFVVLPELFNAGYEYHERNYHLAEPIDGPTVTWMKAQAAHYGIHLAGSLLLLDEEDIYNTGLIVAPDGRMWRYDKQYPFAWERAYFRENRHITVADTDLGKVGMMICWDAAHPDLWARYAGKVDMMVIPSCPPKISSADIVFPDRKRINIKELGGVFHLIHSDVEYFPGPDLDDHAAWMGVPVVQTVGAGTFRSRLPEPFISLGSLLGTRPDLWNRIVQAPESYIEAGYDPQTKIVDGMGRVLARSVNGGDSLALAEVRLPDSRPQPERKQPPMRTSPWAYLMADLVGAATATRTYRREVRRRLGAKMAPVDPRTRVWVMGLAGAAAAGWLIGKFGLRLELPGGRQDK